MNNKKIKNSGITLIALVITIIVLLILAGVSIATLTGNNGLLNKTSESKTQTVHASIYEQMQIEQMSYITEKNISGGDKTFEEYLNEKGIIGNDEIGEEGSGKWQINVSVLLGSNQVLGNGDATEELKDVYVLEKQSTSSGSIVNKKIATIEPIKVAEASTGEATYKVIYYGKDEQDIAEIGIITDNTVSGDTNFDKIYSYFYNKNLYDISEWDETSGKPIFKNDTSLGITGSDIDDLNYYNNVLFIQYKGENYIIYHDITGIVTSVEKSKPYNIDFDFINREVTLLDSIGEVVSINSSYNPKITVTETGEEIDLSSMIVEDANGKYIILLGLYELDKKEITISMNVNGNIVKWSGIYFVPRVM